VTDFIRNEQLLGRAAMSDAEAVRTVRLSIPAQPEFITLSRLALAGLARVRVLSEETLADLKLAITEACSNSVRHAYAGGRGTVEIVYRLEPDRIEIEVSDDGRGFDHLGAGASPEDSDLSEGGLGIAIIRSIADDLEIASREDGRGSRLRFVKNLDT
jgi:serine/threonine-protein kinase RsbW